MSIDQNKGENNQRLQCQLNQKTNNNLKIAVELRETVNNNIGKR